MVVAAESDTRSTLAGAAVAGIVVPLSVDSHELAKKDGRVAAAGELELENNSDLLSATIVRLGMGGGRRGEGQNRIVRQLLELGDGDRG